MESNDYPLNIKSNSSNLKSTPIFQSDANQNAQNNPQTNQNIGTTVDVINNNIPYDNYQNKNLGNNNGMNNIINNPNKIENSKNNQIILNVNQTNDIKVDRRNNKISNINYSYSFFDGYQLKSKFLMKVYGIVFFEFVFIFALVLIFQIKSIKNYIHDNPVFALVSSIICLVVFIIIIIIFQCCPKVLNAVPTNYILLFLVAICLGLTCAFLSACYSFEVVIGAVTCVIAISIGCLFIVLIDKNREIKAWHLILGCLLLLCIQFSIMAAIFRSNYIIFLYDIIGALIYTLYIAFDAIIIRDSLSIDDYIFGALILTIDMVRLLIILLKILGYMKGE